MEEAVAEEVARIVTDASKLKLAPAAHVVHNHSTHNEGMQWLSRKLAKLPTLISTVKPSAVSGDLTPVSKLQVRFKSQGEEGGPNCAERRRAQRVVLSGLGHRAHGVHDARADRADHRRDPESVVR